MNCTSETPYIRTTTLAGSGGVFLGDEAQGPSAAPPSRPDGRGREWRLWAEGTAYAKLCDRGTEGLAEPRDGRGESMRSERQDPDGVGPFKIVGKPGGDFKVAAWYGRLCLDQTRSMFISYPGRQTDGQSHAVF